LIGWNATVGRPNAGFLHNRAWSFQRHAGRPELTIDAASEEPPRAATAPGMATMMRFLFLPLLCRPTTPLR
jgi:hypothetical protein